MTKIKLNMIKEIIKFIIFTSNTKQNFKLIKNTLSL
jgi:hypothetical protein